MFSGYETHMSRFLGWYKQEKREKGEDAFMCDLFSSFFYIKPDPPTLVQMSMPSCRLRGP